MTFLLIALWTPPLCAVLAGFLKSRSLPRILLIAAAAVHFISSCVLCFTGGAAADSGSLIGLDAPGRLFLMLTSLIFLAAAVHCAAWLKADAEDSGSGGHSSSVKMPERLFVPCLLAFLTTMTLAISARHFGLLWVGIEATTLASAPLIYFHRNKRSLEATWKYLLICSVGIGLALFGSLLLSAAGQFAGGDGVGLSFRSLLGNAASLHQGWLKAAFIFMLAGYGTKMGLAPFHTWLPDAYSEVPSPVSALLSGALINCSFLGVLRAREVCVAAGLGDFCGGMLVALGILSLLVATLFIIGQTDYKRLLAYSSVEHMGMAAFGAGIGGMGLAGSMLHIINHSIAKAMLFMLAGNILLRFGTRSVQDIAGLLKRMPSTGTLWLLGLLAIGGIPPSGLFASEFIMFKASLGSGSYWSSAVCIFLLAAAFAGMSSAFLKMALGNGDGSKPLKERLGLLIAPALLCAATFTLGIWMPEPLASALETISRQLGG